VSILLSESDIKAICERPSKLSAGSDADSYQMERYMNVAKEAAAPAMADIDACPGSVACRLHCECQSCWLSYLDSQQAPVDRAVEG